MSRPMAPSWLDRLVTSIGRPYRRDDGEGDLLLAAMRTDEDSGHVGIVRDISATGMTLCWPRPLARNAAIDLRVACPHGDARVSVVVATALGRPGATRFYLHRCAVVSPSEERRSLIERVEALGAAHERATEVTPSRARWSLRRRLGRAIRHRIHVPVRLGLETREVVSVTRDFSATGLSVVVGSPIKVGQHLHLELAAPEQRWRGHGTVARCEQVLDGQQGALHICGIRFDLMHARDDLARFRQWIRA